MNTPSKTEGNALEILRKWVVWLKTQGVIKFEYEIGEGIEMSRTTVSQTLSGKTPISDRFINRFEAAYLAKHNLRFSDYEEIKGKKKDIEYATLQAMMEELLEQNKQILALLQKK